MATTDQATAESLGLNTFDPAAIANPHRYWKLFRETDPMIWSENLGGWILSRYEDVRFVLRDPARFSSARGIDGPDRRQAQMMRQLEAASPQMAQMAASAGIGRTILNSDPPDHTRLRRLVDRHFTPRTIMELAPQVQEMAERLVAEGLARGTFDVMADLANPLSTIVIAQLLGVPAEDWDKFKRWSTAVTEGPRPDTTPEQWQERLAQLAEFTEYLTNEIAKRRRQSTDDLIGRLVAARDEADALTEDELLAFIRLLLVAGNETTTKLMGNAVLALIDHPDQDAALRSDPQLMDSAIEEFLRYDGTVQFTVRAVTEPLELHGRQLEPNVRLFAGLASANRDEEVFPDGDDLILSRQPNRHVAFGDWIHICLGQHVARLEMRSGMRAMLTSLPSLELAVARDQLPYQNNFNLRGLASLPLKVTA